MTGYPHVERIPNVRSGNPCIEGTRVEVRAVYYAVEDANRDPHDVAEDFDISIDEVYEALAYAHRNTDEIREIEEKEQEFIETHY